MFREGTKTSLAFLTSQRNIYEHIRIAYAREGEEIVILSIKKKRLNTFNLSQKLQEVRRQKKVLKH